MKLLNTDLQNNGHLIKSVSLPVEIKEYIQRENWNKIDELFQKYTSNEGFLYSFLEQFHEFSSIEFIISIRDAKNEYEEDGIWHDDGSRKMAFSLSLTEQSIEGGVLELRPKNGEITQIPTPKYGEIIIFLTGEYGFEHKILAVTKGRRIIIAGWCS